MATKAEELRIMAQEIKNETQVGANTAERVGTAFEQAANGLAELSQNVGGVAEELALGAVYDVSAKNPTGGSNNDGKWESLSVLLTDTNLSTLIPTPVRKGGMSIKFVQSSDNKYVQFRCKPQTFSANPEDWAIADEGVYIENPEFLEVKTDSEKKVLEGFLKDGTKYLPKDLQVDGRILNKELNESVNGKIDKINPNTEVNNEEVLSHFEPIENPEFLAVDVDKDKKILGGYKKDGTKYLPGDLQVKGRIFNEVLSYFEPKDNPEFLNVVLDKDKKILGGYKKDGDYYFGKGVPSQVTKYVQNSLKEKFPNEYYGKEVKLGNVKRYFYVKDFLTLQSINSHCQGCAVYGNYLFMIEDSQATKYFWIFDLTNGERIAIVEAPSGNHYNNMMFSNAFPVGNTQFPYLYAGGGDSNRLVYVFSVTLTNNTFTISLVQTLDFTNVSNALFGGGQSDFAIDFVSNTIYTLAYENTVDYDEEDSTTFVCSYQLPNVSAGNVSFSDNDVITNFIIPNIPVRQCLYYYDGDIYILSGYSDFKLVMLNIKEKAVVTEIDFTGLLTEHEAEAFVIYKNKFLLVRAGTAAINEVIF